MLTNHETLVKAQCQHAHNLQWGTDITMLSWYDEKNERIFIHKDKRNNVMAVGEKIYKIHQLTMAHFLVHFADKICYYNAEQGTMLSVCQNPMNHQPYNLGLVTPAGAYLAGNQHNQFIIMRPNYIKQCNFDLPNVRAFALSPNGKNLYYSKINDKNIYVADFMAAGNIIQNERVLFKLRKKDGFVVDFAITENEQILCAKWDGWGVLILNHDGKIIEDIALPLPHVSSLCLGGDNMNDLFIATSYNDDAQHALKPEAGNVVVFKDTPYKGVPRAVYEPLRQRIQPVRNIIAKPAPIPFTFDFNQLLPKSG